MTELTLLGFTRDQYVGQQVESFVYMDLEKVDSNNYLNTNTTTAAAATTGGNTSTASNQQQPVSFVNDRTLYKEVLKQITSGHPVHNIPIRFVTYSGTVLHLILDCDAVPVVLSHHEPYYRCFTRDDTARRIQEMRSNVLFQETNRSLAMLDNFMNRSMVRLSLLCCIVQIY